MTAHNIKNSTHTQVCDKELCQAIHQAKCDARCALQVQAKRRKEKLFRFTAANSTVKEGAGTLHAGYDVWPIWDGQYGSHLGYIRDCFGYSAAGAARLRGWNVEIAPADGSHKTFRVQSGRERIGLCYAMHYIGTVEDQSTTSCHDYQGLRQKLCPECCEATPNEKGCTGGCSP